MSVRLMRVLERADLRVLGDLHGMPFEKFAKLRNCGSKTVRELNQIIATAQRSTNEIAPPKVQCDAKSSIEFTIPEHVQDLALADLPVSRRLAHILEAMDVRHLGQLHGHGPSELLGYRNCGRTTIGEIRKLISRAASGEFDAAFHDQNHAPSELLKLIEHALPKLPQRDRNLILDRLGGRGHPPQTLEQLSQHQGVTRERVRQIVDKAAGKIRVMWGPRIPELLHTLRDRCLSSVIPLTPDLLSAWLGNDLGEFKLNRSTQIRLIGLLDEMMPCWPDGHDGIGFADANAPLFAQILTEILLSAGGRLSLPDAFCRLRQERGQAGLDTSVFLACLRRARRLVVEFPDPEHPIVRVGRVGAGYLASQVLAESENPLTAEEVHRRAIQRFGADLVVCEARAVGNALSGTAGVYLVGPGLFGMPKHFHLAPSKWKSVRNEFVRLLERENRPISAYEVVDDKLLPALSGDVRAHEVASAVREDSRITDLGFLLFSLTKWGVEERQLIRDLIPDVLRTADRLLTTQELGERLRRHRSVSSLTIANFTAKCPGVRYFGHGYFGLASWSEDKLLLVLANTSVVENAVRRAELPLRFAGLCELFGIRADSPLSVNLWNTCEAVEGAGQNSSIKQRVAADRW